MRATSGSILALCLVAAACSAGEIHLPKMPDPPPQPMPAEITYNLNSGDYLFFGADQPTLVRVSPAGLVEFEESEPGIHHWKVNGAKQKYKTAHPHTYQFEAVGKGTATVEFFWADGGAVKTRRVVIECNGARPPPPKPDPKPDPKDDAPIPAAGLHVLVVFESGAQHTAAQNTIFYGKRVRDWLDTNCVAGPDGKTRQYRIWDQDTDGYSDSKLWGDAMKRKRTALPWVIVSNGVTGFEGPLPADADSFLELVKKYGGK